MEASRKTQYVFDASVSQWMSLGKAGKACSDVGLRETMQWSHDGLSTIISLYDPRGELVVYREFSPHDIDYASQWMHKQARDYQSWK